MNFINKYKLELLLIIQYGSITALLVYFIFD